MENLENLKRKSIGAIIECSDEKKLQKIWEILYSKNSNIVAESPSIYESEKPMTEQEVEDYFNDEVVELPTAIMEILKISEKQFENGEFHTEEEIDKMDEEWLK